MAAKKGGLGRGFDALLAEALRRLPPEPEPAAPPDAGAGEGTPAAPEKPDTRRH